MFRTTNALFASNEMVDFMLKELEAMKRRVVEEIPALLSNLLFVSVWRQRLGWGRFMSVCVFVVLALLLAAFLCLVREGIEANPGMDQSLPETPYSSPSPLRPSAILVVPSLPSQESPNVTKLTSKL